ncbi:DUF2125 domain-containing protein [Roseivivax marinus]|uniref:DUF2125 domain-containing protein n=1 Tax=Roseivivax marinus TaxID=1379903 RepID=UPI001F03C2A8|nr:DUF2125 domain-containing protein [Roseivivax marinus]UMA63872.1 DUF2125 domain-containing protein [Roseivivax marinus]
MRLLAALIVVAALAWSGLWAVQAWIARGAIEDWAEAQRAAGWEVSYSDLDVGGFPNRVDVRMSDLAVANPEAGWAWEAPFLQAFRLVYKLDHFIFAFPERQVVSTPEGTWQVDSEGLRASLVLRSGTELGRLHVEADSLVAEDEEGGRTEIDDLRGAFDRVEDTAPIYRLSVAAETGLGDGPEDGGTRDPDIALRADVTFDAAPALDSGPVRPVRIEIDRAEYAFEAARLRLDGDVDVDGDGRLSGDVSLLAENWQALLDEAVDDGRLEPDAAETLEGVLGLVARIRGSSDTLDVGLRLEDGAAYLGPVPLGQAPRLRF